MIKILFSFCLVSFLSSCSKDQKTITLAEVKEQYSHLFQIEVIKRSNRVSFSYNTNLPDRNYHLGKLMELYPLYIDYLLWNYSGVNIFNIFKQTTDSAKVNELFIKEIQEDTIFNAAFLPFAYHYLNAKGIAVIDYKAPDKTTYTNEELVRIASKFFYASGLDTVSKSIQWYICVGKNPYFADKALKKNPGAEAFSFMTLMNRKYKKNKFHNDFENNIRTIENEVRNLEEPDNKLNAVRNRMQEEMVKSKDLEKVLLIEFRKMKKILPFQIIEN